jgi:uridine kinase
VTSFESVSTWRQPLPEPVSAARSEVIFDVAGTLCAFSERRLRVAIDGRSGAGKTSFGHELGAAVRELGRPTLRASMDDFKHPWRDARERGYDRKSGEGYYRNAYDFDSSTTLLLVPAGAAGSGDVVLCAHDPLTGEDQRATTVKAPHDAILIVDTMFAMRPEYDSFWDFRIWIDVDPRLSMERGIARDTATEGIVDATNVHQGRYRDAEEIYLREVDPLIRADLVVDNNDLSAPFIVRRTSRDDRR